MATIQFLAGNPKRGKKAKKKAVKKVASKAPKKAVKKGKRKPMSQADRKAFAERMAKARGLKSKKTAPKKRVAKKASRKIAKKRNPQYFVYSQDKKGAKSPKIANGSVVMPTAREASLIRKEYQKALKSAQHPNASDKVIAELRKWRAEMDKSKELIRKGLDEQKSMLKKGFKKIDSERQEDPELAQIEKRISASKKQSDTAKKANLTKLLQAKERMAKARKAKKNKPKKKTAKKSAKKSQQGEDTVAKRRKARKSKVAKKKVTSKKVAKKVVSKKRKGGKKKTAKRSKRRTVKFHLRGKNSKSLGIRIFKNPNFEAVLGIAPAELTGLAIGGFSYGAVNDLAKRYLPQSVAKIIAKAGPVSGAVVPAGLGILLLAVSKKYLAGKSYAKHVDQFAKGVIASAVVATGASLYEIAGQKHLQQLIAPKGAQPLAGYEDDFGAVQDEEFGAIAHDEFGDVEDFGAVQDDEFGDVEEMEGELNEWGEAEHDSDSTY
jgi:hypothetical protein